MQRAARVRWVAAGRGIVPARAGTYLVPVAFLDTVAAQAWDPARRARVEAAYDAGLEHDLPPVRIYFWGDGEMRLDDGNHRLVVARVRGAAFLRVEFVRVRGVCRLPAARPIAPRPGGEVKPTALAA